jgi:hypothetical protein
MRPVEQPEAARAVAEQRTRPTALQRLHARAATAERHQDRVMNEPLVEPPAKDAYLWEPHALATAYAGFWLLMPLVSHLGIAHLLQENPELLEVNWPVGLLRTLAHALHVPADDATLSPLTIGDESAAVMPAHRMLTARWIRAMRAWCRRADISLAAIVRRPGTISATRTHLDIFFDPRYSDIRIRKAGLDVDPGWLPWLGRVIYFHYELDESNNVE